MDSVTVRIHEVSTDEIEQLNTAVSALSNCCFQDYNIEIHSHKCYVLSIKHVGLSDISETLDSLRRVVKSERIIFDQH